MADIKFILGTDITFEQAAQYIKQMAADGQRLRDTLKGTQVISDKEVKNVARTVNEVQKLTKNAERFTKQQELAKGIIGKEEAAVRRLRHEWKAAGTEAEKLAKKAELDKTIRKLKVAKTTTSEWSQALGSFAFKFNALGNIAANALSRITQIAKQAARESLKIIMDFEQAMADVRSITQATEAEFKKLNKSARDLGGSTKFTAVQVAQLQKEYAKLGFSTQEILNASEATLNLAAATGTDLARSAEVAGSTVRAFNLDATETQRIVDVMARSFTSSALDMERFSESMKYVAPVAKALGVSIEETTAMLSALANAGIHGSQAGTALRRIFLQLAKDGRPVAERMRELASEGITVAGAQDEVGQRAATAMLVLGDQQTLIEELTGVYREAAGAAQEMADIQLDTLKGQVIVLKSALSELVLEWAEFNKFTTTSKEGVTGLSAGVRGLSENFALFKIALNPITGLVRVLSNELWKGREEIENTEKALVGEGEGDDEGLDNAVKVVGESFAETIKKIRAFTAAMRETQALEKEEAEYWAATIKPPDDVIEEDKAYQEQLKQDVTDIVDYKIAEYEREKAARKAAFEIEKAELLRKAEIYNTFSDTVLQITNQTIAQGELSMKKFGEVVIIGMLDMLRKIILIKQAEALTIALAQPDSIATFGITGIARAAIINGLITAAFGAAKAAISGKFAEGGYTGDGAFRDDTGERVAGVVHEKEFVINRRQTSKYKPLLEDINAGRDHAVWNALNIDLNKSQTGVDYNQKIYEHLSQRQPSYWEDNEYYYLQKGNTVKRVAKT